MLTAQHKLEAALNLPCPRDTFIKQQVSYKDPGRTGANVLWDFSQLEIQNAGYELTYSARGDSIIGTEHRTNYIYGFSNNTLRLLGYENTTTQMQYLQPELQKAFPVVYNDSSLSYFQGKGWYGDRLQVEAMGTIRTHADSYGMMILPNKDTLNHVLRVKTVKRVVEDTKPVVSSLLKRDSVPEVLTADSINVRLQTSNWVMETETHQWYAKGYRYPVFETIKNRNLKAGGNSDYFETAFFYPPGEQSYLENDEANRTLRSEDDFPTDPWAGLTYNIYPNPVKTSPLNVEIYLPKPANIHVQLRNTMGTVVLDADKGHYPIGICSFQFETYTIPIGNYILDIWLDEKLINSVIMKR
ncbi:hypothetical protein FACS1894182_03450 [Bacteroidia bacterium]|nr:hypothetical protein FACS1894182_03450 [Bacteroidia bacterium]